MALLTAEFGPYVAADYVDDGYADDSSIRVTAALTCDGNIYRFVAVNEAYPAYTWDSTGVWDDWPDNIWGGEGVTLPVRSSSSVTAAVTHAGIATAAVVALQTTAGNHIFAGRDISLAMTATQTTVGNHIFAGRDISLDMTATQTTVGNYIHKATGTLPVIYTVPSILAGVAVRSSSSVTAAVTHAGIATAAVVALQTTAGNHIFAGRDISLAMTATQTTVGNHIFAGRDISLDMTATQTTVGNYIHKATGTLPVIYTVPSILAGVARFATVSMPGVFTESIDQSGLNGTAGILFRGVVQMNNVAAFNIDQSGLNGTAGIFFRATPATIQAFATKVTVATFIYRDPYRFLYVASETRVLRVPPREEFAVPEYTRLIKAIQETRTYTVPAESRTLAEGVPKYDNYRRRHL